MGNLFSIFDPNVMWLSLSLNWFSSIMVLVIFPTFFWVSKSSLVTLWGMLLTYLIKEFMMNFKPVSSPGHGHWALGLFLFILLNNIGGLCPYVFTATSHLSFSVSMALIGWFSYTGYMVFFDLGSFLAHLVPTGTPYILMPFMVLIELVSSLIRPLTLSVRLAANLVAGHLLMVLVSSPMSNSSLGSFLLMMSGLVLLLSLESAVAFIQAYVFSMLSTLYLSETNSMKFNYLWN